MIEIFLGLVGRLPVWLLLSLSVAGVIGGDFFAKYWSLHRQPHLFGLAILGYLVSSVFYIPTLLRKGLVITSVIWGVASTIGFIVIGILVFKEELTPLQSVATFLGTVSLLLFAF